MMTSRASALFPEPQWILAFLALGAALGLGMLLSTGGTWVFFLPFAAIGGLVVLRWPFLGLLLLTGTIAIENLLVVGGAGGATGPRLLGMAVFGAWIAGKLLRREPVLPLATSALTITAGLLFLFAWASQLWAAVPSVANSGAIQLLQFIALALLTLDLVTSWDRADLVVKALIAGAMIAALLTLQQALFGGARRAGGGIAGGISSTAILLVTCLPFAFYLLRSQTRIGWRILGIGYFAVAVSAVILTFSRVSFLVLPPLLLALYAETLTGRRGRGWLVGATCVGLLVVMYSVPLDRVEERVATIVPYLQGTVNSQETGVVEPSPRGYHVQVGLAIARDHPIVGAGFRNYGHLFRDEYQFFVPGPGRVYGSVRSPHSSHVGMLADLGLVGFSLWLAMAVGAGLFASIKAWRRTSHVRHDLPHLLCRAVTYALALQVVAYGWSQTIDRGKLFWVLLGLAAAVGVLTRSAPPGTSIPHSAYPGGDVVQSRWDRTTAEGMR